MLNAEKTFEEGQRLLGELLGFDAGNDESDAAPDPWWLGVSTGLVFEDHAGGEDTTILGATKAKQAALHPDWVKENVTGAVDLDLTVVLVTPCTKASAGAKPPLKRVRYWLISDFRTWAAGAIDVIRELKATLPPGGDLVWRISAASKLEAEGLTLKSILDELLLASDEMSFPKKK